MAHEQLIRFGPAIHQDHVAASKNEAEVSRTIVGFHWLPVISFRSFHILGTASREYDLVPPDLSQRERAPGACGVNQHSPTWGRQAGKLTGYWWYATGSGAISTGVPSSPVTRTTVSRSSRRMVGVSTTRLSLSSSGGVTTVPRMFRAQPWSSSW